MSETIININSLDLGSVSSSNTVTNSDTALCKNVEELSSEIKCELPAGLVNVKSIKNITVHGNFNDFTELNLTINTDYTVPAQFLPSRMSVQQHGQEKRIHLEANLYLKLSGNNIDEMNLSSVPISGVSKAQGLIPGISCFNFKTQVSITEITIPFITTDQGTNLQGDIIANVAGVDYNGVLPCN
jgi:hypothetical protein